MRFHLGLPTLNGFFFLFTVSEKVMYTHTCIRFVKIVYKNSDEKKYVSRCEIIPNGCDVPLVPLNGFIKISGTPFVM